MPLNKPKYHPSVAELSEVEWSKEWMWAVTFPDMEFPAPFTDWFPATSVTESVATLETHGIQGGFSVFSIPISTELRKIEVTFAEPLTYQIAKVFLDWINKISGNGTGRFLTLRQCVKRLNVYRYTSKETFWDKSDWVYPGSGVSFSNSSQSGVVSHSLDFIICGESSVRS